MPFRLMCLLKVLVPTTCLLAMIRGEVSHLDSKSGQDLQPEHVRPEDTDFDVPDHSLEDVPGHIEDSATLPSSQAHDPTVKNATEPDGGQPEEGDVAENPPEEEEEGVDSVGDDGGDSDDEENDDGDSEGEENDDVDDEGNGDGECSDNDENCYSGGNSADNTVDVGNSVDYFADGGNFIEGDYAGDGNDGSERSGSDVESQSSMNNITDNDEGNNSTEYVSGAEKLPFKHPGLLKHEEAVRKIMARGEAKPRTIKIKPRKVKFSRKAFYNYKSLKPKKVDEKCKCGEGNDTKSSRIVNGQESHPNFFPWMVSIMYAKYNVHFCGGSVVCDKYVLSAAHCAVGLSAEEVVIRLGDHNLVKEDIESAFTVEVAKIIIHTKYNPDTTDMDIALFKLKTRVMFKNAVNVASVCLTPPDVAYYGENVVVAGWGNLKEDASDTSSVLNFVELLVLGMKSCRNEYELFPSEISQYMLCAFRMDQDACQGDSGGPLLYFDKLKNQYFQMGIVSWGIGCAKPQYPGVYTKLSKVVGWVYDNTKDCTYCEIAEPSNIKPGKRKGMSKIRDKAKKKKKKKKKRYRQERYGQWRVVRNKKPQRTFQKKARKSKRIGRRAMTSPRQGVVRKQKQGRIRRLKNTPPKRKKIHQTKHLP